MTICGIDIGSADSVVAYVKRGVVDIVQNEVSSRKTPSLVGFTDRERLLGDAAQSILKSNLKNTARNYKQVLGRKMTDPSLDHEKLFALAPFAEAEDGCVGYEVNYKGEQVVFSATRMISFYLQKLLDITQNWTGDKVSSCVISVPSYYSDVHRQALADACEILGLSCLRLMNENTATALAYGIYRSAAFDPEKPTNVAFCSMGHSAFSCAIVQFKKGQLTVVGESSDTLVGGREMDRILMEHFAGEFKKKFGCDPLKNAKATLKLEEAVAKTKKTLSANYEGDVNIECLMEDEDLRGRITREEFEAKCATLVERTRVVIRKAIEQSKIAIEEVNFVELVGGASRVPWVKNVISEEFKGMELSTTLNADECVARGCALQAAMLSPLFKVREFSVTDFSPFEVKISWTSEATENVTEEDGDVEMVSTDANSQKTSTVFQANSHYNTVKMLTMYRKGPFEIAASYDETAPIIPGTDPSLGTYTINLPSSDKPQKVKVRAKLNLSGVFSIDSADLLVEAEEQEVVKTKVPVEDEPAEEAVNGEPAGSDAENKPEDTPSEESKESKEPETKETKPKEQKYRVVEEVVVKKVTKRINIAITKVGVPGYSDKQILAYQNDETRFQAETRLIRECDEARNDLETYVYTTRNQLSDSHREYANPETVDGLLSGLNEVEEWLYDQYDATKAVFVDKLEQLSAKTNPIKDRYEEAQKRGPALVSALAIVAQYRSEAASVSEDYAHIPVEERQALVAEANELESSLQKRVRDQDAKPRHEDLDVRAAEIEGLAAAFQVKASTLMSTPKPAPPPAEEKEEEKDVTMEGAKEESTKSPAEQADAMDVDSA